MAAEGYTTDTNLHVGVALPLHHATHKVVFGNQVLGLHQMDSQHSLQADSGVAVFGGCVLKCCLQLFHFITSVPNSGSGVVCCGRVG